MGQAWISNTLLWESLKFPAAELPTPIEPCGQKGRKQLDVTEEHSSFTKVLKEGGKQQIWFSEDIFLDSRDLLLGYKFAMMETKMQWELNFTYISFNS